MKKLISVFLCILIVFSVSIPGSLALTHQDRAGNYLKDIGIFRGYEDGTLRLERNITRAEFSTLAVKLIGLEGQHEARKGKTPFRDVAADFWASGYINIAVENRLFAGYPDGTFRPQGNITYAEALTVLVSLLGYKDDVQGSWPDNYMNQAALIGLNQNINYPPDYTVSRGDVALLIYNALSVKVKN